MTAARRVAALESSLQPLDVVLRILVEAQEYASIDAYARAVAEVPIESAPMSRIGAETEASVRATMKGKPREEIDQAVRRAVGDAIFRYILFLRINTAALEIAEREGLRAATCFYWMGCLLGGPREAELEPADWKEHQKEQVECWRSWRGVVASILLLSLEEEEAREQLEARYLGGRPALLAETKSDWDRFAEQIDRLWSISEKVVPLSQDEEKRVSKLDLASLDERVAERVRRLADDARVSTFERLGETPRAAAIMERRSWAAPDRAASLNQRHWGGSIPLSSGAWPTSFFMPARSRRSSSYSDGMRTT
jgi:hypothetical protein